MSQEYADRRRFSTIILLESRKKIVIFACYCVPIKNNSGRNFSNVEAQKPDKFLHGRTVFISIS